MSVRSITPNDPANFTPTLGDYNELRPFRFWCQKVLPLVYDDSLSYYELLCKVVDYLNKSMEDVETLHNDVTNLHTAYEELQGYINNYFSTLDVQEEINNKLDEMASDGTLTSILNAYLYGFVNAVVYGLSEDNKNAENNSDILIELLSKYKHVYIPDGTFPISKTIEINSDFDIKLSNLSTLKVVSNIECLVRIGFNKTFPITESNRPIYGTIKGGILDGNNLCNVGIGINFQRKLIIDDMQILHFNNSGIQTGYRKDYSVNYGAKCSVSNCIIDGTGSTTCIGINDQGADNYFYNVTCKDCIVGATTQGSLFVNCSFWCSIKSLADNAECFRIFGNNCQIINCRQDTMKYGFSWDHGDNYYVDIANFVIFNNTEVTSTEQILLYDKTGNDTFEKITMCNVINTGSTDVIMTNSTKGSTNYQINVRGVTGSNEFQKNLFTLYNRIGNLFTGDTQNVTNVSDFETTNDGLIYFDVNDNSFGTGNGMALKFTIGNFCVILVIFATGVVKSRVKLNGSWGNWHNV